MHWTDRQTDRPTDRQTDRTFTGKFDDYADPHLIQQCLGPPQAPPEIAAPTVKAVAHTDHVTSPMVTMVRPKFACR